MLMGVKYKDDITEIRNNIDTFANNLFKGI